MGSSKSKRPNRIIFKAGTLLGRRFPEIVVERKFEGKRHAVYEANFADALATYGLSSIEEDKAEKKDA